MNGMNRKEVEAPDCAIPMIMTSDKGYRPILSDVYLGDDVKELFTFFKSNCLTVGFSVQTIVNREKKKAYSVMIKGRPTQKICKKFLELGDEFHFSWAFVPSVVEIDGEIVEVQKLNWIDIKDVLKRTGL